MQHILEIVPDFTSWKEAEQWIELGKQLVKHSSPQSEFAYLEWKDITEKNQSPFGLYSSKKWRQFALATFLADLISYPRPADQVNFERLLFVMHAFPQGFRIWWMNLADHGWWPVGYTGWYPMSEMMFEQFQHYPERFKDRLVAPYLNGKHPHLYLFNYSAAPILKNSNLTKQLMKSFAKDVQSQNAMGLASITVSEDGVRIAKRFGMTLSGYFTYEGCTEGIYTHNSLQSNACTSERR